MVDKYPELRLRMVKGAYKEADNIAYQTKEEIDENYIRLINCKMWVMTRSSCVAIDVTFLAVNNLFLIRRM